MRLLIVAVLQWSLAQFACGFHGSAAFFGVNFFDFLEREAGFGERLRILEVGSRNVNGGLRKYAPGGWRYIGVDVVGGRGVDVVLKDPYHLPFPAGRFNATISVSAFEHIDFFWLSFVEMLRVTQPDGFVYLNVPGDLADHGHEVSPDSWRFLADAGGSLERWGRRSGFPRLQLIQSFTNGHTGYQHHADTVMLFALGGSWRGWPARQPLPDVLPGAYDDLISFVVKRNFCWRRAEFRTAGPQVLQIAGFWYKLEVPDFCCKAPHMLFEEWRSEMRAAFALNKDFFERHRAMCLGNAGSLAECCSL